MKSSKNYIIVGQGLVGSLLALQLEQKDIPFKVYSNGINHSTKVAAGLINPIVFKRLNKCFGADYTIDFAYKTYDWIERKINSKFIFKKDYCRIFASIEEENNWLVRQNQDDFIPYLHPISENKVRDKHEFETQFGQGFVKNTGFMHTETFLSAINKHLKANGNLIEQTFDYNEINRLTKDGTEIIFCEGYMSKQNPHFSYLPLNTTKGDIIDISNTSKKTNCIINKGVFVLPLDKNTLRVGATYEWNTDDPTPSEKGKLELIKKLEAMDQMEYTIVQHRGGIRPTVKDRRPLIGTHPAHKNLHIINGMGTRGVALAPYWIDQFIQNTLQGIELPIEVNIRRFDNDLNVE